MSYSETAKITISYDNVANDHAIDLNELAASLMGFARFIEISNSQYNGSEGQVKILINATRPGSFETDLIVIINKASDLFTAAKWDTFLTVVGIGTFITGVDSLPSLLTLLHRFKGKLPTKKIDLKDGNSEITINNTTVTVNNSVLNLYETEDVRAEFLKFASPLAGKCVNRISVKLEHNHKNYSFSEADYELMQSINQDKTDLTEVPISRRAVLKIATVAFDEKMTWRMTTQERKNISVKMKDESFIKKINDTKISFCKGDSLDVTLETTKIHDGPNVRETHSITHVFDHIPSPKQLRLKF